EGVRLEEQRKRRRVQFTLAGSLIGLVAAGGFAIAVATLWQRAEGAKAAAETAQSEAETARDSEKTARHAAELARDREMRAREQVARVEYGRTMEATHQEWRDNNLGAARALLLQQGRDAGVFGFAGDPAVLAGLIFAALEGAILVRSRSILVPTN